MKISRRSFLHEGCTIVAATLLPGAIDVAEARFPRGVAQSGFNGGRSQVNLGDLQVGGDYPFLNVMKTAQAWGFVNNASAPVTPNLLDVNGYPTSIVNGGVKTVFYVPTQAARPGNYVITWTGNGTIVLGMAHTTVSGSLTGSGGSGRYVFSTTANEFSVGISALSVTNLQVFHTSDETALLAGQVFGVQLKSKLAAAKFGVIRFLNWQHGNTTNITTWSTRKPASYVFYSGSEVRSALYCTTPTSLTGTQFSATGPSGFALADKAMVHVVFGQSYNPTAVTFTNGSSSIAMPTHGLAVNATVTFDGTTNGVPNTPTNFGVGTKYYVVSVPDSNHVTVSATSNGTAIVAGSTQPGSVYGCPILTMNISGSGNISILSEYSSYLSFGGNSYPIGGTYQSLATLVYDAELNAWIKQGGDAAIGSGGIDNGCPPELMVELCKEVGAHPYFISPPLACTPMTDFHTQLATYCLANAPSWMVPRFEGANELWNSGVNFFQTGYANAIATAYGWGADFHNWYGRALSTIGQAINAVYGGTPATQTKYRVICGVQTSTGSSGGASSSNARLASTQYLTQTPQAGYTATAASGWVTHVCCAQYVTPSDYGQSAETTLAAAFAGKAFIASVASGVMNVTQINASASAAFAIGDTIFDTEIFAVQNIPSGVTITSAPPMQTVTSITKANPAVVSVASPPANGSYVYIKGAAAGGMTQLPDGWYQTAGATGSSYQLSDFFGNAINSISFGTYTSGATSQTIGNFGISNSSITVASQNMTAATSLTAPNTFADTTNSGSGSFTITACAALYADWKAWAQTFSVQKMCGYEGGYSSDYTSNGNSQADMLRAASKLDPNLSTFTTTNYNNFVGLTGGGFVAEFPSCFQFSGNPNVQGFSEDAWSVAEDVYQTPVSPQWTAIVAFNA